jgi:flagellar biosynthetic protein FlhB
MNLQLFAAEEEGRTHPPTERKLRRAREIGYVPRSAELVPAVVLFFQIILLSWLGYTVLISLYKVVHQGLYNVRFKQDIIANLSELSIFLLKIILPFMVFAFVIALLVGILQVGGLRFTPKALTFNFNRIKFDISKLFRRLLPSKLSLVEYSKSIFKVFIISFITFKEIKNQYPTLLYTLDTDITQGVGIFCVLIYKIIITIAIFLVIMAVFDYLYQRHEYKQNLMMTAYELKEEYKLYEGDPYVKLRLRQKQREVSRLRMVKELQRADVVITNPVRLAIAIRYDISYMRAPMVVAKGRGYLAERIIYIATQFNIPIIENRPLAEALYNLVNIGEEIPLSYMKQ